MGRLLDLSLLLIAFLLFITLQAVAGALLDPFMAELLENGNFDGSMNAEDTYGDMFVAVVRWAPRVGLIGLVVLVAYREWRRQRITARRGVR